MLITTVFLRMVLFLIIFSEIIFFILFFNIKLVKNYSYNMWGKHCNFPKKLLLIATVFFPTWFFFCVFVMFFPKIIFVNFIFLILSWLRIAITSKYKFFLTKHYGLIQFFLTWFFSSFFCVFFFCNIFFQNYLHRFYFF